MAVKSAPSVESNRPNPQVCRLLHNGARVLISVGLRDAICQMGSDDTFLTKSMTGMHDICLVHRIQNL